MSCNTINVPCFLGLFGLIPRHHLMRLSIGFRLITTSSFGSGTESCDTKPTLEVATEDSETAGVAQPEDPVSVTAGSKGCQQECGLQLVAPDRERGASPSYLVRPRAHYGHGPSESPRVQTGL